MNKIKPKNEHLRVNDLVTDQTTHFNRLVYGAAEKNAVGIS